MIPVPTESPAMRILRRLGLVRLAWALRRLHVPVPAGALVLEVGSGGNPFPRANVLLDAYEETRERHWASLVADRPTVLAFGERLPFKDGAFDFVICCHVLEHTSDPAAFLEELQRVARAGYIESPDALFERLTPYLDHRLEVHQRNGRLFIRLKECWRSDAETADLVAEWSARSARWRRFLLDSPFDYHVRLFWQGRIAYTIVNPGTDAGWPAPAAVGATEAAGAPARPTRLRALAVGVARWWFSQRARNRRIELLALLACVECGQTDLAEERDQLVCAGCGASFLVRGGVPRMIRSAGERHPAVAAS